MQLKQIVTTIVLVKTVISIILYLPIILKLFLLCELKLIVGLPLMPYGNTTVFQAVMLTADCNVSDQ